MRMTFATISRTARILGFKSRSTLYSWIDKGYLDDFLYEDTKGPTYLKQEGLREFMVANTVPTARGNVLSLVLTVYTC